MDDDAGPSMDMDSLDPKREDDMLDYEGAESDDSFEPEEEIDMDNMDDRVWLIKLPKFLMEKWSAIEQPDVVLGTLRVYNSDQNTQNGGQKLVLRLPEATDSSVYDISSLPRQYSLKMQSNAVANEYVMASKVKERERNLMSSKLAGKIVHECHAFPIMDASYTSLVASRHREANMPKRQTKVLEHEGGDVHRINMLASGAGENLGRFADFVSTKKGPGSSSASTFERAARMPRNELMDALFTLFREAPNWSIRDIRTRTRQPEAYLREVLQEIAFLHRNGPFSNSWSLLAVYKGKDATSVPLPPIKAEGTPGSAMDAEEVDDEIAEDEDEDDFDMEEVL